MPFEVIPAIDLRGGHVVRLRRGDFGEETSYGENPAAVAEAFVDAGARWLHVVDLDGARDGRPGNLRQIRAIAGAIGERTAMEVAGGLRTPDAVAEAVAAGGSRIVVGTAALKESGFAAGLVSSYGAARVAVAIDVRDGRAIGEGWRHGAAGEPAADALHRLADAGVRIFEVTAISRDGLLEGPDVDLLGALVALRRGSVIASGGISSIADLRAVADLGCEGAIVGRAIYEGRLDLRTAIEVAAMFG